ncbi:MAG: hypothetical protein K4H23_05005, partial [Mollicutes bacterium PWAP]|nr:hypothetical protein [Mollicutes bacterium PWAP]
MSTQTTKKHVSFKSIKSSLWIISFLFIAFALLLLTTNILEFLLPNSNSFIQFMNNNDQLWITWIVPAIFVSIAYSLYLIIHFQMNKAETSYSENNKKRSNYYHKNSILSIAMLIVTLLAAIAFIAIGSFKWLSNNDLGVISTLWNGFGINSGDFKIGITIYIFTGFIILSII